MPHPALASGAVAVVTGGASGIGLASARRFAALGLHVCIVDLGAERIKAAVAELSALAIDGAEIAGFEVDVSDRAALVALEASIADRFGGTDILMNNAAIQIPSDAFGPEADWRRLIGVNQWGVIDGCQVFAPRMVERGRSGLIINTGSKQGITNPPGNPAYSVSKAAVKTYTEALQHQLRNTPPARISAHLLIPGFVWTPLAAGDRTEKPSGAWTASETADFMLDRLAAGDFYILCPDNDVDRATDEKRMAWSIGDVIENRPALSRWHPAWSGGFAAFLGA